MQFNHDNMTGPLLAADLVNLRLGEWTAKGVEAVLHEHAIRPLQVDDGTSAALRRWSIRLHRVFVAAGDDERCAAVNALLVDGVGSVYLTSHDGLRPHLYFTPEEDDLVGRVMAVTAGGLAIFTVEAEGGRLGACANAGCGRVFVDTSRNGRRVYCSARCGNADAVRRHRARKSR